MLIVIRLCYIVYYCQHFFLKTLNVERSFVCFKTRNAPILAAMRLEVEVYTTGIICSVLRILDGVETGSWRGQVFSKMKKLTIKK